MAEHTEKQANRLSALVMTATAIALVAGWLLFAWHTLAGRETVLARTRDLATSLSRTLAEHVEQTFAAIDAVLLSIDERPDLPGVTLTRSLAELHTTLQRLRRNVPVLHGLSLIDAQGFLAASSERPDPPRLDGTGRAYFQQHRASASDALQISAPVRFRTGDFWTIPVSRRLEQPEGGFAGVVAAFIRPDYFQQIYHSSGAHSVTLAIGDGTMLAHEPDGEALIETGARVPAEVIERLRRFGAGSTESTALGGSSQIVGVAPARSYPVLVSVGFDRDVVLASWRRQRDGVFVAAACASVLVLAFAVSLLRLLREQRSFTQSLREAKLEAEAANRAKSEFLAHMSHELRTPLNAINGFAEIMASEMFGPLGGTRYVDYAHLVKSSGDHLLSIINNVLDMAKVDAGKWEVDREPVELEELFTALEGMNAERAKAANVALVFRREQGLPTPITDRRLLLQVLLNLVSNGIKFTPAGGKVSVAVTSDGDGGLQFAVQDTGEGMTEADVARVSEPFGRASSLLARTRHDTGLGLVLSQRFTKLLGGELAIDSRIGHGTCMMVRLPAAAIDRASQAGQAAA